MEFALIPTTLRHKENSTSAVLFVATGILRLQCPRFAHSLQR